MHNRRQLLASAAAFGAAAAAPKLALAAAPTGEAAKMYAFFDKAMAQTFGRSPELPTALGIDKGDLAWTKSELSDYSLTALAENKVVCDLDVDAPDLHILLDPQHTAAEEFLSGNIAQVEESDCDGCGICRDVCRFEAVALTARGKAAIDPDFL